MLKSALRAKVVEKVAEPAHLVPSGKILQIRKRSLEATNTDLISL